MFLAPDARWPDVRPGTESCLGFKARGANFADAATIDLRNPGQDLGFDPLYRTATLITVF